MRFIEVIIGIWVEYYRSRDGSDTYITKANLSLQATEQVGECSSQITQWGYFSQTGFCCF